MITCFLCALCVWKNAIGTDYRSTFTTGVSTDIALAHYWTFAKTLNDQVGQNNGTATGSEVYESIGLNFAQRTGGVALQDDNVASVLGGTASLSFYMKTTQTGTNAPWTAPGIFGRDQVGGANDVFWGWIDMRMFATPRNRSPVPNVWIRRSSPTHDRLHRLQIGAPDPLKSGSRPTGAAGGRDRRATMPA